MFTKYSIVYVYIYPIFGKLLATKRKGNASRKIRSAVDLEAINSNEGLMS